jgi:diguanylate cyclase (GGDEF)-like protein/PAS domain S-box-containing protein
MLPSTERLEASVHHFALAMALLVALSIPLGFGIVSYQDITESLNFKAKVKASALSSLIASNPDVWMYAENRIQGLISREPVPLADELVQVLDKDGTLLTRAGSRPDGYRLSRAYALHDVGQVVGQVVVSTSSTRLIRNTLLSAALSFLLAALVYVIMKSLPLKALKSVTDALFREKDRVQATLHSIGEAVVTTDVDGAIDYMNPVAEQLFGRKLQDLRGSRVADVIHLFGPKGEPVESSLYLAMKTNSIAACQADSELRRPDGTAIAVEECSAPINDRLGAVSGGVVILRDVSVTREYVRRRSWEATHDALTGLLNRREFESRVQLALLDARNSGRCHVVCYLDLDRFKVVNDACGHAAGDELLIQLTQLMQARVRDTDTSARLGGDEFGILLEGCDKKRGQLIAADILAAVNDCNFSWESKFFSVGVSIGLTEFNAEHASVGEIIGEADCACYWAKEQGKNRVVVFVASDMALAARRSETTWVGRINDAFRDHRFVLYHQTYKALNPLAVHNQHLEVLLRMTGEDGEVIAPGRFLPAAERYNLMPQIDRWVIHEVFSRFAELVAERGGSVPTCAINLSGASINSDGFLDFIRESAQQFKFIPGSICFELTETVAVNNLQAAAVFINECKLMGFQFALDDFGTGTSSFGYLKHLPVDYLKIDGSFVRNIEHDSVDYAMVETMNRIGHLLGKRTVAEYAENELTIGLLAKMGVDFAQGYGVCLPKPLFPVMARPGAVTLTASAPSSGVLT